MTFFEELILFVIGYPLGIGIGMLLARAMGNTASFLSFVSREPLPISMRGLNIPVTLVALLVTLVARMVPAGLSTRSSAVEVDRERARPQKAPFWYRAYFRKTVGYGFKSINVFFHFLDIILIYIFGFKDFSPTNKRR